MRHLPLEVTSTVQGQHKMLPLAMLEKDPDDVTTNSDAGHGTIGFHVHLAGFYSDLVSSFLASLSFFLLEWECLLCAFVYQ